MASFQIRVQRLHLAAGAVQRQHQLSPQPLTVRMLRDELLEFGHEGRACTQRQVGFDSGLERVKPQLEPRDLRREGRFERKVGERRPTPERERIAARARARPVLRSALPPRAARSASGRPARARPQERTPARVVTTPGPTTLRTCVTRFLSDVEAVVAAARPRAPTRRSLDTTWPACTNRSPSSVRCFTRQAVAARPRRRPRADPEPGTPRADDRATRNRCGSVAGRLRGPGTVGACQRASSLLSRSPFSHCGHRPRPRIRGASRCWTPRAHSHLGHPLQSPYGPHAARIRLGAEVIQARRRAGATARYLAARARRRLDARTRGFGVTCRPWAPSPS